MGLLIVLSSILGLPRHSPAHGVEFTCAVGDVACLIDAINQANANGEANTITLEVGTYTLTAVDNTTDGPNGLPSVTGVVTIQGAGADTTIIERAAGAPGFRLVHVAATGTLTLERLTLRGGNLGTSDPGGGLLNQGGTIALAHVLVTGNNASDGAGLYNMRGTVTIGRATFTENSSFGPGGGVWINGGTVTITETTFARNGGGSGGGIANGGGIADGGSLVILNSSLADNGASRNVGGGLANFSGTSILINTTFARNTACGFGIPAGGGIHNSGMVILTNSTLVDNTACDGPGGGLANGFPLGTGTVVLTNTILAPNSSTRGGPDCAGPVTLLGHNLIGDPTGCSITLQPTDLTGDPGLGAFTDDGTPGNGHFPLLAGSPAIDAANDAFCPPTDQLGEPRVGSCDIGAIEFQGKHHR